jgi:hypothetical protein
LVLAVVGLVALAFTGAFFTLALLAVLVFLAAESVFCRAGFFAFLAVVAFAVPFLTAIFLSFINTNVKPSLLVAVSDYQEPPAGPRNHL